MTSDHGWRGSWANTQEGLGALISHSFSLSDWLLVIEVNSSSCNKIVVPSFDK